jgi:hypothetical protein
MNLGKPTNQPTGDLKTSALRRGFFRLTPVVLLFF